MPYKYRSRLIVFAAAALLLLAADLALLLAHPGVYRVAAGNFLDKYYLAEVHRQERDPDGATYRWTRDGTHIWLSQTRISRSAALTLELGSRPAPADVALTLDGRPWAMFAAETRPRAYTLLLPPDRPNQVVVGVASSTFQAPGDTRHLGVKLRSFALSLLHDGIAFPIADQYLAQLVIILAAQLVAIRLGARWRTQAALAGVLAIGLAILWSTELLLAHDYMIRLALASVTLAGFSYAGLPLLELYLPQGEARRLWVLTLAACAIRLFGAMFPLFSGQDMGPHTRHLTYVAVGDVFITSAASEFGPRIVYPSGLYVAALPGILLTEDLRGLLQTILALLDGITGLFVALLALRLGGNRYAAYLALILYAGNLAAFGAMSYGFAAQVFGQWFIAPLALLLIGNQAPARRHWVLAGALFAFALFSHIGVAILATAWVGLALVMMAIVARRGLIWGYIMIGAAGLTAFMLLYPEAVGIILGQASRRVGAPAPGGILPGYRILLVNGMRLAYSDIGLALVLAGGLLASRLRHARVAAVAGAWIITVLVFLVIDLVSAMQVRYFYFGLAPVLALVAVYLGRLAERGRMGQIAAWVLVGIIVIPSIVLWLSATWAEGKIPMTPLTH